MNDSNKLYLKAVLNESNIEQEERKKFTAFTTLTISEVEEILANSISNKLRKKLESALQYANHNFKTRHIHFGDLKDD